jgi:hypothetical protein
MSTLLNISEEVKLAHMITFMLALGAIAVLCTRI